MDDARRTVDSHYEKYKNISRDALTWEDSMADIKAIHSRLDLLSLPLEGINKEINDIETLIARQSQ